MLFIEIQPVNSNLELTINADQILEIGPKYILLEYANSDGDYVRYELTKEDITEIKRKLKVRGKLI